MSAGIDAMSGPAARAQEFNEKMVRFYVTKDATEMISFLSNCHPEAAEIFKANPFLIRDTNNTDLPSIR